MAMIKHHDEKELGEERVDFGFQLWSIMKRRQDRSSRKGPGDRN